jgi:hypothetical protein
MGGPDDAALDRAPPDRHEVVAAASRLRAATNAFMPPGQVAWVLAAACLDICRSRPVGSGLIARIAHHWGYSPELLDASLAALVKPFTVAAIGGLARKVALHRELIGFVMPGNVPGAGLHEVVAALISGAAVIIKAASGEPFFFQEFARLLAAIDSRVGARIAVFNWSRDDSDLTAALRQNCDRLVVFGADDTVANLQASARSGSDGPREGFTGFGSRVSGVILAREVIAGDSAQRAITKLVASDVTLFEQRGCLSPHHVFVEDGDGGQACGFAGRLASEMATLARELPPPRWLGLEPASAVRLSRERARWRGLGGQQVRLWEGGALGWTVIYDRDTPFRVSPGIRTVYVSPFNDAASLELRLQPVNGQIEAFALAGDDSGTAPIRAMLDQFGATYICRPGAMQSPPPDWPHGGGAFLRSLLPER